MQLEVHANGADTELQCAALVAAGCDALQGRRLGSWMEERALESWFTLPASQRRL
jgi:EAL domain-containing protein (putative c-di-GMP-specific phosphodiesterase class I)